jgi:uncharacterized protein
VDFIIGDHTAIEVKAKSAVSPSDLRGLRALGDERGMKRLVCVSLERSRRQSDGVAILPVGRFLDELWTGGLTA